MLFLFIHFILSKTVIKFDNLIRWSTIKLYFGPLDEIEINIKKGYGIFLGYWKKDLFLYVDADTRYGPFDEESGIAGVYFKNINYSILLINDGLKNISFQVKIDSIYPDSSDFPVFLVSTSGEKIENLDSPFIYYLDQSGRKVVLIVMTIVFGIISIVPYCMGK